MAFENNGLSQKHLLLQEIGSINQNSFFGYISNCKIGPKLSVSRSYFDQNQVRFRHSGEDMWVQWCNN